MEMAQEGFSAAYVLEVIKNTRQSLDSIVLETHTHTHTHVCVSLLVAEKHIAI